MPFRLLSIPPVTGLFHSVPETRSNSIRTQGTPPDFSNAFTQRFFRNQQ